MVSSSSSTVAPSSSTPAKAKCVVRLQHLVVEWPAAVDSSVSSGTVTYAWLKPRCTLQMCWETSVVLGSSQQVSLDRCAHCASRQATKHDSLSCKLTAHGRRSKERRTVPPACASVQHAPGWWDCWSSNLAQCCHSMQGYGCTHLLRQLLLWLSCWLGRCCWGCRLLLCLCRTATAQQQKRQHAVGRSPPLEGVSETPSSRSSSAPSWTHARLALQITAKPNVQAGQAPMHLQHRLVLTESWLAAKLFLLQ